MKARGSAVLGTARKKQEPVYQPAPTWVVPMNRQQRRAKAAMERRRKRKKVGL